MSEKKHLKTHRHDAILRARDVQVGKDLLQNVPNAFLSILVNFAHVIWNDWNDKSILFLQDSGTCQEQNQRITHVNTHIRHLVDLLDLAHHEHL